MRRGWFFVQSAIEVVLNHFIEHTEGWMTRSSDKSYSLNTENLEEDNKIFFDSGLCESCDSLLPFLITFTHLIYHWPFPYRGQLN